MAHGVLEQEHKIPSYDGDLVLLSATAAPTLSTR